MNSYVDICMSLIYHVMKYYICSIFDILQNIENIIHVNNTKEP